jgi:hypothetical protein
MANGETMTTARSKMVQVPLPFMPKLSDAELSPCGTYRYMLSRSLDHQGVDDLLIQGTERARRRCLFVMLNPSTADALLNDPTIEKCIKFARAWGYQRLDVVNLYAYRATDPKALRVAAVPSQLGTNIIGPNNDNWIASLAADASRVVLAWGGNSPMPERAGHVLRILETVGHQDLCCLKQNKDGSPVHPLYQRDDSVLQLFDRRQL